MDGVDEDFSFVLDMPVRTEWTSIEVVRSAVKGCLVTMLQSLDTTHSIAMVTGELLENAVKYGDWSNARSRFRLRMTGRSGAVRIEVTNPLPPASGHAERLRAALEELHAFASPAEAYVARIQRVAAEGPRSSGGLGLARIEYEGRCRLEATFPEPARVSVIATTLLEEQPR